MSDQRERRGRRGRHEERRGRHEHRECRDNCRYGYNCTDRRVGHGRTFAHPRDEDWTGGPPPDRRGPPPGRRGPPRDQRGPPRDQRGPPPDRRLEDLEHEQMAHASEIAALQAEVQSLRDLVCQLMNPPPQEWVHHAGAQDAGTDPK